MLESPGVGELAPDFQLPDDRGEIAHLSALRTRSVVLYFYPKDDTSSCTLEAQEFDALLPEFDAAGAALLGMSPDSPRKHARFKSKYGLSLRLVSDEAKTTLQAYSLWVEKSMYGRKYMGVERSTFLIDRTGRVVTVWRKVKSAGHAAEVLSIVRSTPTAFAKN